MAEEYDVQAIMKALNAKEEMDPDQHDGCYELMCRAPLTRSVYMINTIQAAEIRTVQKVAVSKIRTASELTLTMDPKKL